MANITVQKKMQGVVVSDKMNKTRVVRVSLVKNHELYKKRFVVYKKFVAHDETNETKVGDIVSIIPTKPMSKTKRRLIVK
ncbi:MAG: 30S ribosomal protein S17 [Candidatus Absconditabacterales bacterium]|nr:30S ribosomal protein S17 [Candidatus Absconditabacterales bacterium]